ncbi:hypothetical protein, partial [Flavobacterium aquidurense]|uniref:hypothetical protein n=1 Tax=Flavobacterium aquidurense TaxID=362413 RepID=UPI003758063D
SPPAQMVLQLCGRVCRRLSFKNPHHLFDGDFLFYKILQLCGSPDSYRGSVAFLLKTLGSTRKSVEQQKLSINIG